MDMDIEIEYRFIRQDTKAGVTVKRGMTGAKMMGVGGRWNVINRPRRTSFTTWDGSDLYTMDVPIFFDGWDTTRSMEDAISILNQMRIPPTDNSPPPTVRVEGALPVKNALWVITGIDFEDEIWHENGYRLRQYATVHLLQFNQADQLEIKAPQTSRIITVKAGDTLKSISKDQYGTPIYWSALRKANGIRDHKTIKVGQKLRIPVIVGK